MSTPEEQRALDRRINYAINLVGAEVERAMGLHKGMVSLHEAKAVIEEEFDEFWELVKVNPRKLPEGKQKERMIKLREELVQLAAMCVRSIVDLDLWDGTMLKKTGKP